jgi:hypothetical protein
MGNSVAGDQSGAPLYLEIELDAPIASEIEALAAQHGMTPFGMCAALLGEAVARRDICRIDGFGRGLGNRKFGPWTEPGMALL